MVNCVEITAEEAAVLGDLLLARSIELLTLPHTDARDREVRVLHGFVRKLLAHSGRQLHAAHDQLN